MTVSVKVFVHVVFDRNNQFDSVYGNAYSAHERAKKIEGSVGETQVQSLGLGWASYAEAIQELRHMKVVELRLGRQRAENKRLRANAAQYLSEIATLQASSKISIDDYGIKQLKELANQFAMIAHQAQRITELQERCSEQEAEIRILKDKDKDK